jgi:plastocyanin
MKRSDSISLFFIILLFACNSPPKQTDIGSTEEDISTRPLPSNEPKTHIVEIRQMKFEPQEVRVRTGDRVVWINKDITNHDVTEQSKKAWASSPLTTGQSWSLVVTRTADYYCNLHQVMKGKIVVVE